MFSASEVRETGVALCRRSPQSLRGIQTGSRLTTREIEVIKLVADGKTYKEIGMILGLSWKTVDGHVQRIRFKTQCHSIALMVRFAIRNGWAEL